MLPLTTLEEKNNLSLPLQLNSEYSRLFESIILTVSVKLTSSPSTTSSHPNVNQTILASEFNEIYDYSRSPQGRILNLTSNQVIDDEEKSSISRYDFRHILAQCYEWQWYMGGENGHDHDPFIYFNRNAKLTNSLEKNSLSSNVKDDLESKVSSSENFNVSGGGTLPIVSRIDCPMSLSWLQTYTSQLEDMYSDIMVVHDYIKFELKKGSSFRPSTQKKQPEVQAIPINLHYQLLASRLHSKPTELANSAAGGINNPKRPVSVYIPKSMNLTATPSPSSPKSRVSYPSIQNKAADGKVESSENTTSIMSSASGIFTPSSGLIVDSSITCGSFSPHGLGHKKG